MTHKFSQIKTYAELCFELCELYAYVVKSLKPASNNFIKNSLSH